MEVLLATADKVYKGEEVDDVSVLKKNRKREALEALSHAPSVQVGVPRARALAGVPCRVEADLPPRECISARSPRGASSPPTTKEGPPRRSHDGGLMACTMMPPFTLAGPPSP